MTLDLVFQIDTSRHNSLTELRYHGTPKLTMLSKNTLPSFSDRYYSNLSFAKSFRKKLFLRKVMDEKRFVALIFSNHVLTVICQQR